MKKLTEEQCEMKVKKLLKNGQSIVIVSDNDDAAYESGWADYLTDNYKYYNFGSGFRVNLEKKAVTI